MKGIRNVQFIIYIGLSGLKNLIEQVELTKCEHNQVKKTHITC